MRRILSFTAIMAFVTVFAIECNNERLFACGMDNSGGVTKAEHSQALAAENLENVHLKVDGMTCGMCAGKIKAELAKLPEVKDSEISWEKGTADVKVTQGSNHKALGNAVKAAGFKVTSIACECKG